MDMDLTVLQNMFVLTRSIILCYFEHVRYKRL